MENNKSLEETANTVEKIADLQEVKNAEKATSGSSGEITFDNEGNMVWRNRAFVRNQRRLWRSVTEGHRSVRFFTQSSGIEKPKTNRATKKRERQNRRAGRNRRTGRK